MIGMVVAWHTPGYYRAAAWITLIGRVVAVSADLHHALVLAPDSSFARLRTAELFAPSEERQAREHRNMRTRERRQARARAKRSR